MDLNYEPGRDFSSLGLLPWNPEDEPYFCTPKGANIFGRAGVDGIHYCTVPEYGTMIFAVSPMNGEGEYLHPIARNWTDLLRLWLARCGMDALEQAWQWDRGQFDTFLRENPPEDDALLETLAAETGLSPMEDPWEYLRELRSETDGPWDAAPVRQDKKPRLWQVRFHGGLYGPPDGSRAGRELPVEAEFFWGDTRWMIPAVYSCAKGLVVDFCIRVPAQEIDAFLLRWNCKDGEYPDLSGEERLMMEADNPLNAAFRSTVTVNGRSIRQQDGSAASWIPSGSELPDWMEHYHLDPADGWTIWRLNFPWATKRRPKLKSLTVTLQQDPVPVVGPHITTERAGQTIDFAHPVTGARHTLTVQALEQETVPGEVFLPGAPDCLTVLHYTVEPPCRMSLMDRSESDPYRLPEQGTSYAPEGECAAAIGIIGGVDGPTAVCIASGEENVGQTACSSLHYEPVERVEWNTLFYRQTVEDKVVELPISEEN